MEYDHISACITLPGLIRRGSFVRENESRNSTLVLERIHLSLSDTGTHVRVRDSIRWRS